MVSGINSVPENRFINPDIDSHSRLSRMNQMSGGGWPSTTGNPSGGGRWSIPMSGGGWPSTTGNPSGGGRWSIPMSGGGWPSTTGNPSGGGRWNN